MRGFVLNEQLVKPCRVLGSSVQKAHIRHKLLVGLQLGQVIFKPRYLRGRFELFKGDEKKKKEKQRNKLSKISLTAARGPFKGLSRRTVVHIDLQKGVHKKHGVAGGHQGPAREVHIC